MVSLGVLGALAYGDPAAAGARSAMAWRGDGCRAAARRYETQCLMPRIEARMRYGDEGDAVAFVARMRDIDHACVEVTAEGLEACATWPRVEPSAEYRHWLRAVREGWQRREQAIDGARPACPPGVWRCL